MQARGQSCLFVAGLEAETGGGGLWRLLLGSWVLGSGEMLFEAGLGDGSVVRVVRCRLSLVVTASLAGMAKLWSSASGERFSSLEGHGCELTSAVFSPDGELVVTASFVGTAKFWSSSSGECLWSLEGHCGCVWMAVFSPDGELVITASHDRTAMVWTSVSWVCLMSLEGHGGYVGFAGFSPDG